MSEPDYLKCRCQSCGNAIEFPASGLGLTTACPHCGQSTVLATEPTAPAPTSPSLRPPAKKPLPSFENPTASPTPKSRSKLLLILILVAIVAGAVVALLTARNRPTSSKPAEVSGTKNNPTATSSATDVKPPDIAPITPSTTPAPKSIADLKTGSIIIEKAKGSSLIYAVGVLRNDSSQQRFGVNIELELTDARGNKVGTAKDYRAVLEPRQEWRFRALVLDSKAVAATVSSIREE